MSDDELLEVALAIANEKGGAYSEWVIKSKSRNTKSICKRIA